MDTNEILNSLFPSVKESMVKQLTAVTPFAETEIRLALETTGSLDGLITATKTAIVQGESLTNVVRRDTGDGFKPING